MFTCRITKVDDVIWMKHVPYDIQEYCNKFKRDEEFTIYIDGQEMSFIWMKDGSDGRSTPGIKATLSCKQQWNAIPRNSIIKLGIPE